MRLLKSKVTSLQFEDLGVRGKAYEDLKKQVDRPTGMIITTGPTGSGKTTTLYAILNKLNDPETKIITLEDPIEYNLAGIAQSQIDHSAGYSFADGLRSILRQDPDIIMVGELRDLETVEVSIQAALTGHQVLSTLHTNDASGASPRFLSMGAKPYLLAPALNAVIGQRLVRKIHDKCKIEFTPEPAVLERVKELLGNLPADSGYKIDLNKLKFYRGQGCDECNHIGLKGRIGIYEIFTLNPDIEKEILSGKTSEYIISKIAHDSGMISMVQDGLLKAMDAITTVDEVFRVVE
jgi:type II secretory ATPase GspE/PulE/Tfp pilus assembly ATPase PilB-like protein